MPQFTSARPLSIPLRKPRNPVVAPALFRQAGRHQSQRDAQRQQIKAQLHRLLRSGPPDDSP